MLMRLQEIMSELRAGGRLSADDWALVCEMNTLCLARETTVDGQAERRRAADRERAKVRRQSADNPQTAPIIKEDIYSEGGVGETSPQTPRKPIDALAPVLGAELGRAIVEHRQKLRAPLTPKAAEQLAKRLKTFPDPKAAAEKMLEKGWKSIELDWGAGKSGNVVPYRPSGPKKTWAEIKAERDTTA